MNTKKTKKTKKTKHSTPDTAWWQHERETLRMLMRAAHEVLMNKDKDAGLFIPRHQLPFVIGGLARERKDLLLNAVLRAHDRA